MKEKLDDLATKIMSLYINEGYRTTWNERIEMMELTLLLIEEAKEETTEEKQLHILRGLIKEALNLGLSKKDPTIRSYKREKLYNLTCEVKEQIEKKQFLKYQEEEITDLNSWVKSLQIFKMGEYGLEDTIYETSYELYQGMRKIVLEKTSPNYKKIYVSKIVERLEAIENQQKLPHNITIYQEDYELYQVIRLIKGNRKFNLRYNHDLGKLALKKSKNLDYQTNASRVLVLIKDNK